MTAPADRKIPAIAVTACLLFSFALYAFLIFGYLPESQFLKYPVAVQKHLQGELSGERLLDYSPLYFYLHLLIRNPHAIVWMQILFISVSSTFLLLMLNRFFGRLIACIGTLLYILQPSLIVYTEVLEPEPLVLLLLIAFLYLITTENRRNHLLAGICFGLGVITRPTFLPLLFVVPFYLFLTLKQQRLWMKSSALFVAPAILLVGLIWIRNFQALGKFSPAIMNPGTTFFEGNNPNSVGLGAIYPPLVDDAIGSFSGEADYQHELYRLFARRVSEKKLSVREVNRYWTQKAWVFLRDHPMHAFRLAGTKLFHVFHNYQWHDLYHPYRNEQLLQKLPWPHVPFGLLSSLCVIGLGLFIRNWKNLLLIYSAFFCQLAVMIVIYVHARHRLAILPLFIFFACGAIHFIAFHKRRWIALLAALPLLFVLFRESDLMKEETHLWEHTRVSNSYLTQAYSDRSNRKWHDASRASAIATAAAPWLIDSRRLANLSFAPDGFYNTVLKFSQSDHRTFSSEFDFAVVSLYAENIAQASMALNRLITSGHKLKRDHHQSSEPYYYLAKAAALKGKQDEAITTLKTALDRSPGDPYVLSLLTVLTGNEEFKNLIFRYFDDIDAHFYLGKEYLQQNKPAVAVPHFEYVVKNLPEYRRARVYLAAALGEAGRLEEGATVYREAIRMKGDPVLLEQQIVSLFKEITDQKKTDAFGLFSYATVLRQYGYLSESRMVLQTAQILAPSNKEISNSLTAVEKILAEMK